MQGRAMNMLRRGLVVALAASILAPAAAAQPRVADVSVERSGPGVYELRWRGADGAPVDVYVSERPDAPRRAWRLVADNDGDGQAVVRVASGKRPYFYVALDRGTGMWAAERVLPLQGGRNFRDLGGYATADGRRVKWGKIYRSGSMAGLTTDDYGYLSDLGIKFVCDLRTRQEREAEPNQWVLARKVAYWARDYDMSVGDLGKLMAAQELTPAKMRESMVALYRELPFEQAPAYRVMFSRLAADEIPLAFNCSAGKDRAGTGAALILSALGVPRDTIVADYALSESILKAQGAFRSDQRSKEAWGPIANMSPEVFAPLIRSDPSYIRAMFDAIDKKYGSVERYLRDELGVTPADLARMRRQLLE